MNHLCCVQGKLVVRDAQEAAASDIYGRVWQSVLRSRVSTRCNLGAITHINILTIKHVVGIPRLPGSNDMQNVATRYCRSESEKEMD